MSDLYFYFIQTIFIMLIAGHTRLRYDTITKARVSARRRHTHTPADAHHEIVSQLISRKTMPRLIRRASYAYRIFPPRLLLRRALIYYSETLLRRHHRLCR